MRITRVGLFHYALPLKHALTVAGRPLTRREGVLILVEDEKGHSGVGEVAPLPGLDILSLEDCRAELPLLRNLPDQMKPVPDHFNETAPFLGLAAAPGRFNRHVMFGLESALLNLMIQRAPDVFPHRPGDPGPIRVNGLYVPDASEKIRQSQLAQIRQSGFRTIKVKIGRIDILEEVRQIRALMEYPGQDVTLRLDANRSLTLETYGRYYEALKDLPIEYVEEPLAGGDFAAAAAIPWPLAMDESLDRFFDAGEPDPAGLPDTIAAVVLKPSACAGLSGLLRFLQKAAAAGLTVVLSSAFNTGPTILLLARLAAWHPGTARTAHGLDTLKYLAKDVILDSPVIRDGRLIMTDDQWKGRVALNTTCLGQEA